MSARSTALAVFAVGLLLVGLELHQAYRAHWPPMREGACARVRSPFGDGRAYARVLSNLWAASASRVEVVVERDGSASSMVQVVPFDELRAESEGDVECAGVPAPFEYGS